MSQDDDPYRGNLEAATNRADALAEDLEAEKRETDRLRAALAEQTRSAATPAKRRQALKDPPPSSPIDLDQDANAKLFGVQISQSFTSADHVGVQIMAGILVVAMTVTTFLTQRQLMSKNMPADALTGPYAQQQKLLLYVLPVVFAVGGIAFPVGVLFYWTTSNLWTMGQQFYVIRNNPAPGTPAFKAKQERDEARARRHGRPPAVAEVEVVEEAPRPASRQQPKKKTRSQRKKGRPAGDAGGSPSAPDA